MRTIDAEEAQKMTMTDARALPADYDFALVGEKELGHQHVIGLKCEACGPAVEPYQAFGGAQTFADYDRYFAAQAVEVAVNSQAQVFDAMMWNIRSDPSTDARGKADAIASLANELGSRIDAARTAADEADIADLALGAASFSDAEETADGGSGFFIRMKDERGEPRWVAIHSNKYRDREKDIFTEAAHKSFADAVNGGQLPWPTLRPWHFPVEIGVTDFLDYDDRGFMVSSGTFTQAAKALGVPERLAAMEDLGCSHGYLYRRSDYDTVERAYRSYRSFEITFLPRARSANTLTAFFGGTDMSLTPARKDFLSAVLGAENVEAVEGAVSSLATKAVAEGIAYKDLGEHIAAQVEGLTLDTVLSGVREGEEAATGGEPAGEGAAAGDGTPAGGAAADPEGTPAAEPTPEATPAAEPTTEPAAPAAADGEPGEAAPGVATPNAEDAATADAAVAALAAVDNDPVQIMQKALGGLMGPIVEAQRLADERSDLLLEGLRSLEGTMAEQARVIEHLSGGADAHMADMIRPRIGFDPRMVGLRSSATGDEPTAEELATIAALKPTGTTATGAKDAAPASPASAYMDDALRIVGAKQAQAVPSVA